MGQKWSKAQHKKYSETMKAKRNGIAKLRKAGDKVNSQTMAYEVFPDPFFGKWHDYANLMFSGLSVEQKLNLLAKVKL